MSAAQAVWLISVEDVIWDDPFIEIHATHESAIASLQRVAKEHGATWHPWDGVQDVVEYCLEVFDVVNLEEFEIQQTAE